MGCMKETNPLSNDHRRLPELGIQVNRETTEVGMRHVAWNVCSGGREPELSRNWSNTSDTPLIVKLASSRPDRARRLVLSINLYCLVLSCLLTLYTAVMSFEIK